jgi:hypothetical protein
MKRIVNSFFAGFLFSPAIARKQVTQLGLWPQPSMAGGIVGLWVAPATGV